MTQWQQWILIAFWLVSTNTGAQETPVNAAWKGRLYCMSTWATNVDPNQPKSMQEAFLDAPSLLPRSIPGLKPIAFPVDSESAEAKKWFGQGLACLHLLCNEEAERAFRAVVHADPECAIGYWGLAMANMDQPGRGAYFANLAAGKIRPATKSVVRGWVATIHRFFDNPESAISDRAQQLVSDLESLVISTPDDTQTKALYLRQLVLNHYKGDIALQSPLAVDRIAAEIAAEAPTHPANSLRLFLWMNHKPSYLKSRGLLKSSGTYSSPVELRYLAEAQRAAGHWLSSGNALLEALKTSSHQRADWYKLPIRLPGYDETPQVLAETLSSLGLVDEALAVSQAMVAQPIPAYIVGKTDPEPSEFASTAYARGIRTYAQICIEHNQLDTLKEIGSTLALNPEPGKSEQDLLTQITSSKNSEWLSPEAKIAQLIANRNFADATIALESLTTEYRQAFLPRALEIITHSRSGRTKQSMYAFDNSFRTAASLANSKLADAPEFNKLAKMRQLPGNWKLATSGFTNSFEATLGAYKQSFPTAPDFQLPDDVGQTVKLLDYRGKPVLIIFFLGAGCIQCVEQLNRFLPYADDFKKAGIPILAISSDPTQLLKFSIRDKLKGSPVPFKSVSDSTLKVFQSYHVINEFENRPIHGTFLIDKDGKVRWQTTSNQPFMNPAGILQESQRLLF